jgi:hypothetical protein
LTEYLLNSHITQIGWRVQGMHQTAPERRKRVRNHEGTTVLRKPLHKHARHACSVGATRRHAPHTTVSKFLASVTVGYCLSNAPLAAGVGYERLLVDGAELDTAHASLEAACGGLFTRRHNAM